MQALKQTSRSLLQADGALYRSCQRFFADASYDVPAGHVNSDLTSTACHIGLNRRRDISLRADVFLSVDGNATKLTDLFKGRCSAIVGLPDLGEVCRKKHAPEFVKIADELKAAGCSPVYLIGVAPQDTLAEFAQSVGADGDSVKVVGDPESTFSRMMGVDLAAPGTGGAASQRYAGIVQDGILIRMCVESDLGQVDASSADRILKLVKCIKQ